MNARNISKEMVLSFNKMIVDKIDAEKLEVFKEVMDTILSLALDAIAKNKK